MVFTPMHIDTVLENKRLCFAVLGISKKEFDQLLPIFTDIWYEHLNTKKRARKIGGGSKGNIKEPKKKLFFILWYMKNYPTYDLAAYVFASSKSRTHMWTVTLLPVLEKTLGRKIVLPKRQIRTPEEFFALFPFVKEVLLDGVERPTVRRKNPTVQTKEYSGKKKRHTRKNIIVTDSTKKILVLTPTKHGKIHDKRLLDKSVLHIPEEVGKIVDTGFQGLQKQQANVFILKKKPRSGVLTDVDKAWNRLVSSTRIGVEHAIAGMKRMKVARDIWRGRGGQDDRFVLVACGLYNLRLESR